MADVAVPALAGHRFLRGMPASHLAFLAEVTSVVTVPAGHRFFEAGGVAKRFWLIRAGQIAVDMRAPGDGRAIIETETVVMRSITGTVRWIRAEHRYHAKFQPS